MSLAVGTAAGLVPVSWSVGPHKQEVQLINIISGDTGATITATNLSRVDQALPLMSGVTLTAQPTISGNVVTLAFTDPAASRYCQIILLGR